MPTNSFRLLSSFLLLLPTSPVVCAADHPLPDPAGGVTAWGKPVKGLQAGLRCPKGKQRIGPKQEQVTLELVIRNVSDEAIAFKYLPGVRYWGENKRGTVEVTWLYSGNGRPFTAHIRPGGEMLLGTLDLGRVRPKAPPTTAYSPRPELRPGKYQVGSDNVALPVEDKAKDRKLGTGYLDIELQKSK
jgi:hypothetical protein